MDFRSARSASLLALAPLLLLAGCGGDAPPAEEPVDLEAPPAVEAAPSPMDTMIHVTIALGPMNESGVTGEAMAMHSDDAVVVILELEGLPGEGQFNAHIHSGSCADGGPVLVALNPVAGLADGTGTSTTTLEADDLDASESHFIMVHGEGGTPIACGNMEGHGEH
jgi:hypothetical protein